MTAADAAAAAHGPAAWCYDALTERTWPSGRDGQLTVLRALEVVWIRFDSNPAYFANLIDGAQALEDFLAGPPAVATEPEVLAEVHAHILAARAPGRSTWLELELGAGELFSPYWRVDGANPEECPLPGPAAAGIYGGEPASTRRGLRALVTPGAHEVLAVASIRGPGPHQPFVTVEARAQVGLAQGEARTLRLERDGTSVRLI
ncbi:MAG: hypothetical protein IPL61_34990 [Myxococcales bacterium]|nr:hypothetical protein [Myxococcales bacterium]